MYPRDSFYGGVEKEEFSQKTKYPIKENSNYKFPCTLTGTSLTGITFLENQSKTVNKLTTQKKKLKASDKPMLSKDPSSKHRQNMPTTMPMPTGSKHLKTNICSYYKKKFKKKKKPKSFNQCISNETELKNQDSFTHNAINNNSNEFYKKKSKRKRKNSLISTDNSAKQENNSFKRKKKKSNSNDLHIVKKAKQDNNSKKASKTNKYNSKSVPEEKQDNELFFFDIAGSRSNSYADLFTQPTLDNVTVGDGSHNMNIINSNVTRGEKLHKKKKHKTSKNLRKEDVNFNSSFIMRKKKRKKEMDANEDNKRNIDNGKTIRDGDISTCKLTEMLPSGYISNNFKVLGLERKSEVPVKRKKKNSHSETVMPTEGITVKDNCDEDLSFSRDTKLKKNKHAEIIRNDDTSFSNFIHKKQKLKGEKISKEADVDVTTNFENKTKQKYIERKMLVDIRDSDCEVTSFCELSPKQRKERSVKIRHLENNTEAEVNWHSISSETIENDKNDLGNKICINNNEVINTEPNSNWKQSCQPLNDIKHSNCEIVNVSKSSRLKKKKKKDFHDENQVESNSALKKQCRDYEIMTSAVPKKKKKNKKLLCKETLKLENKTCINNNEEEEIVNVNKSSTPKKKKKKHFQNESQINFETLPEEENQIKSKNAKKEKHKVKSKSSLKKQNLLFKKKIHKKIKTDRIENISNRDYNVSSSFKNQNTELLYVADSECEAAGYFLPKKKKNRVSLSVKIGTESTPKPKHETSERNFPDNSLQNVNKYNYSNTGLKERSYEFPEDSSSKIVNIINPMFKDEKKKKYKQRKGDSADINIESIPRVEYKTSLESFNILDSSIEEFNKSRSDSGAIKVDVDSDSSFKIKKKKKKKQVENKSVETSTESTLKRKHESSETDYFNNSSHVIKANELNDVGGRTNNTTNKLEKPNSELPENTKGSDCRVVSSIDSSPFKKKKNRKWKTENYFVEDTSKRESEVSESDLPNNSLGSFGKYNSKNYKQSNELSIEIKDNDCSIESVSDYTLFKKKKNRRGQENETDIETSLKKDCDISKSGKDTSKNDGKGVINEFNNERKAAKNKLSKLSSFEKTSEETVEQKSKDEILVDIRDSECEMTCFSEANKKKKKNKTRERSSSKINEEEEIDKISSSEKTSEEAEKKGNEDEFMVDIRDSECEMTCFSKVKKNKKVKTHETSSGKVNKESKVGKLSSFEKELENTKKKKTKNEILVDIRDSECEMTCFSEPKKKKKDKTHNANSDKVNEENGVDKLSSLEEPVKQKSKDEVLVDIRDSECEMTYFSEVKKKKKHKTREASSGRINDRTIGGMSPVGTNSFDSESLDKSNRRNPSGIERETSTTDGVTKSTNKSLQSSVSKRDTYIMPRQNSSYNEVDPSSSEGYKSDSSEIIYPVEKLGKRHNRDHSVQSNKTSSGNYNSGSFELSGSSVTSEKDFIDDVKIINEGAEGNNHSKRQKKKKQDVSYEIGDMQLENVLREIERDLPDHVMYGTEKENSSDTISKREDTVLEEDKKLRQKLHTEYMDDFKANILDESIEDESDTEDTFSSSLITCSKEEMEDDIAKLQSVDITLPFSLPPLHAILTRSTLPSKEQLVEIKELNIEIKSGLFSKEEDRKILTNWKNFCKEYDIRMIPSMFVSFPRRMSTEKRTNFLRYLAHGLDNRFLHRVHARFKTLVQKPHKKSGKFTADEDKKILEYMKGTFSKRPFRELCEFLNRPARSIEKRYYRLNSENNEKIKWTLELTDKLVKYLKKATKFTDIEELKHRKIHAEEWKKVSRKMDNIPVLKLQRAWHSTVYPRLFADSDITLKEVKKEIIEMLYERNETEWKTVNWKEIAEHFPGFTVLKIYMLFKALVNFHVPKENHEDLKACVRFLRDKLVKHNKIPTPHKFKRLVYVDGHIKYENECEEN